MNGVDITEGGGGWLAGKSSLNLSMRIKKAVLKAVKKDPGPIDDESDRPICFAKRQYYHTNYRFPYCGDSLAGKVSERGRITHDHCFAHNNHGPRIGRRLPSHRKDCTAILSICRQA